MGKDKFKAMQQGGVGSFQALADAAMTSAAIQQQQEQVVQPTQSKLTVTPVAQRMPGEDWQPIEQPRFMRLPNPQIPLSEYNLVSSYCNSFANMTRQDFVELAIIEKLHNDGGMSDEDYNRRYEEIRNRPPRGQRKGTKSSRGMSSDNSSSE